MWVIKYQVGDCWSRVEENKLVGCLTYFAKLEQAAQCAIEFGTGVQPLICFVDSSDHLDTYGKRWLHASREQIARNQLANIEPVIRHKQVLEMLVA